MSSQKIFNYFILALALNIPLGYAGGTKVIFKTKVVIGTCEFDDANNFDQTINLTKTHYLMVSNVEKAIIKAPIVTDTFSYTIKCQNFPAGSLKDIKIQVTPANNTITENGIYFSHNDETNTGFILQACDSDNKNCQNSEDNNGVTSFQSYSDNLITINYHVSLVKRKANVTAGTSTASVSLIYFQD